MLRDIVNVISAPEYSFTAFIILFCVGGWKYHLIADKKFALKGLVVLSLICFWFAIDPVFLSVISFPDNIPIIILLVTVTFFTWLCIHKASINDKRIEDGLPPIEGTPEMREKVWCWPNLVYTELFCIIACTIFLSVWAIIFKAPLEEPANPTWAPNPAKAPWYFLGLQEMLVYFDPWMAGVVLPVLIVVGLIAIPFMDHNPKGNGYYTFSERKLAITSFLFGWLVLWLYLIIVGTFLRGPNWTFYGPFEFWDLHKVVAANNINLSEYFWILTLDKTLPSNIVMREIAGILSVTFYYAGSVFLLTKYVANNLLKKMGTIRYYLFIFLVLTMAMLPIKMYLRWLFDLKYIIAMPEFELNL